MAAKCELKRNGYSTILQEIKKRMPRYLGLRGFTEWEIVEEFLEMPEIIFEKYGWTNKKREKGAVAKIISGIFPTIYKLPQLYAGRRNK